MSDNDALAAFLAPLLNDPGIQAAQLEQKAQSYVEKLAHERGYVWIADCLYAAISDDDRSGERRSCERVKPTS